MLSDALAVAWRLWNGPCRECWDDIIPFRDPSDELTGNLGSYDAVMQDDDGADVTSSTDYRRNGSQVYFPISTLTKVSNGNLSKE